MQPTIAAPFSTEALRWDALITRDRQAEGAFVYAVTTTGVYCRPGCASRLPKREHVRFFKLVLRQSKQVFVRASGVSQTQHHPARHK
jgi:AraC family transcriptional regulator of adaptative response/methylated-DNA-[protein]-cysteine methyltransferase